MATYTSNRNSNGKTDENGHFRLPLKAFEGEIFSGLQVNAKQTPDMTVTITAGDGKIPYNDYSYAFWLDQDTSITIPNSSPIGPRIDRIVAYVDRSLTFTPEQINHPDLVKFKVVSGVPGANAQPASDTIVRNSIGAANPFIELARITVNQNTTSITQANIDTSVQVGMKLSRNISNPGVTTVDGTELKFVIIREGDPLPAPIANTTLIVLETSR